MATQNALSADRILSLAADSLDEQQSLKTPYEAIALIGHACMVTLGFRLVGLGEDKTLGMINLKYPIFNY